MTSAKKKSFWGKFKEVLPYLGLATLALAFIAKDKANAREDAEFKKGLEVITFSSPKIAVLSEKHMTSGYSEVANLLSRQKLDSTGVMWFRKADTIITIHKRYINFLEVHEARDIAILNMVHNTDSLVKVLNIRMDKIERDIDRASNADELTLKEIRRLKALEVQNGD